MRSLGAGLVLLSILFLASSPKLVSAVPCNSTAQCSVVDTECADGSCVMNVCVQVPKMDGVLCAPADLCFLAGQCLSGNCQPTVAKPCDDMNFCTADSCQSPLGICINDPGPQNGADCDDGDPCTGDDECSGGVCGGTPADCSGLDDACNNGACNSGTGDCEAVPKTDGADCTIPFPCIENTTCFLGECLGIPKDCNDDNVCTTDVCVSDQEDPNIGVCQNFWNTINCEESNPCVNEAQCFEGKCKGQEFDCTDLDTPCSQGQCTPVYNPPMLPPPISPPPSPPPPPPPPTNGTNGTMGNMTNVTKRDLQPPPTQPVRDRWGAGEYNPFYTFEVVMESMHSFAYEKAVAMQHQKRSVQKRDQVCQVPLPGVVNPECDLDWVNINPGPGSNESFVACNFYSGGGDCVQEGEEIQPGSSFCRDFRCGPGDEEGLTFPNGICQWRCLDTGEDDSLIECNHGDPCLEWGFCWEGYCAVECTVDSPSCNDTVIPFDLGFPGGVFDPVCTQDVFSDGTPCTGLNPCVSGYLCFFGLCLPTVFFPCDDGVDCTLDFCIDQPVDQGGGCQNSPQHNLCNDGINCTVNICQGTSPEDGGCIFTPDNSTCPPPPVGSECVASVCSEVAGCVLTTQDSLCTNGITCDGQETCNNVTGLCETAPPLDCEDGNECTICQCVEPTGCECTPVPDMTPCVNTTDPCFVDGQCIGDVCVGFTEVDCSGSDTLCGVGKCNSTAGGICYTDIFEENTPCDNNNLCDGRELCNGTGSCLSGIPLNCTNPNQCILTSCHPVDGCQEQFSVGACEDGNPCTENDSCDGQGNCVSGPVKDCSALDDQCLVGRCDPQDGLCKAVPTNEGQTCDNGLVCEIEDRCSDGVCVATELLNCDDRNPCTLNQCVEPTGCQTTILPAGTSCADPNLCNGNETCDSSAVCQSGTPVVCNITEPCEQCVPDTGLCEFVNGPPDACGTCGGGVVDPEQCDGNLVPIILVGILAVLIVAALLLCLRAATGEMHVQSNANYPELRRETTFFKQGLGRVQGEIPGDPKPHGYSGVSSKTVGSQVEIPLLPARRRKRMSRVSQLRLEAEEEPRRAKSKQKKRR